MREAYLYFPPSTVCCYGIISWLARRLRLCFRATIRDARYDVERCRVFFRLRLTLGRLLQRSVPGISTRAYLQCSARLLDFSGKTNISCGCFWQPAKTLKLPDNLLSSKFLRFNAGIKLHLYRQHAHCSNSITHPQPR